MLKSANHLNQILAGENCSCRNLQSYLQGTYPLWQGTAGNGRSFKWIICLTLWILGHFSPKMSHMQVPPFLAGLRNSFLEKMNGSRRKIPSQRHLGPRVERAVHCHHCLSYNKVPSSTSATPPQPDFNQYFRASHLNMKCTLKVQQTLEES